MPHYADGTEAKVGDLVKGKPYNTPHEIVGEIVQITPSTDSCNCIVAFIKTIPAIVDLHTIQCKEFDVRLPHHVTRAKGGVVGQNISSEDLILVPKYDYGALKDFIKV